MEDYYQILGVPEDASEEQIKKRFRELAKIYHPDRGGDPEKFKQILKAYQILSDKKLRSEYDLERRINRNTFSYDFEYETEESPKNESNFENQKEVNSLEINPKIRKILRICNILGGVISIIYLVAPFLIIAGSMAKFLNIDTGVFMIGWFFVPLISALLYSIKEKVFKKLNIIIKISEIDETVSAFLILLSLGIIFFLAKTLFR